MSGIHLVFFRVIWWLVWENVVVEVSVNFEILKPYWKYGYDGWITHITWWRHQMETFSVLLALQFTGNSPVNGEFPSQRPATRSFDVFFDMCLNKRLSKQSWGWWFETQSRSLWRHCNDKSEVRTFTTGINRALRELSTIRISFFSIINARTSNYIVLFYVDVITRRCPNTDVGPTNPFVAQNDTLIK